MNKFNQLTFMIGLFMMEAQPVSCRSVLRCFDVVLKSLGAVDLWLPRTQEVQIGPRKQQNLSC